MPLYINTVSTSIQRYFHIHNNLDYITEEIKTAIEISKSIHTNKITMSELTYVITGAGKGTGKGLLEVLIARPNTTAVAGLRDVPTVTKAVSSVPVGKGSKLIVIKIDSTSATDAAVAVKELKTKHNITKVDVLISNAEYMGLTAPVLDTPAEEVRRNFEVNTIGPLTSIQVFYPLLEASPEPKFLAITSSIGSMGDMESFPVPFFGYGTSKSAANCLVRKLHLEHPKLTSMAFNPGWLQTDMGTGAAQGVGMEDAPMTIEESVGNLIKLFDGANREKSRAFTASSGEPIPW